ncbi:MAG: formylmethanofuran dehydrogenase subunit E family protein [Candidatus Zipacnadales bacterium]
MTHVLHPPITGYDIALNDPQLPQLLRLFHGHIGPFVILGYRLGVRAREVLGTPKYFGMKVTVKGPHTTPYTCLLDGLQMATGCTLGKGNIKLLDDLPSEGCLFEVDFEGENNSLHICVPANVKELFATWMAAQPTEEWLFARTCAQPAETLWQE